MSTQPVKAALQGPRLNGTYPARGAEAGYLLRRECATRQATISPNPIQSSQVRSHQVRSHQVKSSQGQSSQTKSCQVKPRPVKSSQKSKPSQRSHFKSRQATSSQAKPSQAKPNKVSSSRAVSSSTHRLLLEGQGSMEGGQQPSDQWPSNDQRRHHQWPCGHLFSPLRDQRRLSGGLGPEVREEAPPIQRRCARR